jgi:hypothetical protein
MAGLKNTYAPVYKVHQTFTPIHSPIDIAIEAYGQNPNEFKFLCLASVSKNNELRYAGGSYQDTWVKGSISNFGNYTIAADSVAPTAIWNKNNNTDSTQIRITIDDNFSGIGSYQLFLNDNWVLADYDAKNNLLTYQFDEQYSTQKSKALQAIDIEFKAEWTLKLIDKQGNSSVFKWQTKWH